VIGQIISHYKVLERIGHGGMGVVYKAEDTRLKRAVALKFLAPSALDDEEVRARFMREAQAAAALDHPNICATFGIDEYAGRAFIVMAYIRGEDLDKRIARKPIEAQDALDIALGVAQGLQEAHEKGIVHRDIKPSNIKITLNGVAKVMDFGLAKLADSSGITKTGMTIGTAAYMSPEQTLGQPVDHRTDIWSLGVVTYQMLTGKLPFAGEYEQAIRYGVLNEDPEPLGEACPGASPEVEQIVLKAISKDPEDRFQTAAELVAALRLERKKLESGVSKILNALPSPEDTVSLRRSQRRLHGLVIVLCALLTASVAVILWLALR
jgi:eukaryotic-like serine/threonine-protein kinase